MNRIRHSHRGPCCWCALLSFVAVLLGALFLHAADDATITYRRVFKGSNPEFIEIKIGENGSASYDIRQLSEDPDPQLFQVGDAVRAKTFELAGDLHNFAGVELDIHRRIADLGEKTFRYEKSGEVHETHYNYTLNRPATQLALIFEGLFQQQRDLTVLEQKLRYDRLGVNDACIADYFAQIARDVAGGGVAHQRGARRAEQPCRRQHAHHRAESAHANAFTAHCIEKPVCIELQNAFEGRSIFAARDLIRFVMIHVRAGDH